jgi:hypothetical protein
MREENPDRLRQHALATFPVPEAAAKPASTRRRGCPQKPQLPQETPRAHHAEQERNRIQGPACAFQFWPAVLLLAGRKRALRAAVRTVMYFYFHASPVR